VIPEQKQAMAEALAVLAISRRNEEAWQTLHKQTWPFVRAIVYRRLGSVNGLAEDAAQEVFIRLIRSCPFSRLRNPDAFRGYVWRVSDNVARTYRRRLLSHPELPLSDERDEVADSIQSRGQQDVELEELMDQSWQRLSHSDRRLLRMLIYGHSIKEIAKEIGVSYGAAAIRIMRLRGKLYNSLVLNGIMTAEIK
jgi:RNA polymerase sigma factor (sigma-70 family)